jgi:hypothetical protein
MKSHDENPLRAITPDQNALSYEDFHKNLEQVMLGARWQLLEFSGETQKLFEEFAKIDWSEMNRRLSQDIKRLAELG